MTTFFEGPLSGSVGHRRARPRHEPSPPRERALSAEIPVVKLFSSGSQSRTDGSDWAPRRWCSRRTAMWTVQLQLLLVCCSGAAIAKAGLHGHQYIGCGQPHARDVPIQAILATEIHAVIPREAHGRGAPNVGRTRKNPAPRPALYTAYHVNNLQERYDTAHSNNSQRHPRAITEQPTSKHHAHARPYIRLQT